MSTSTQERKQIRQSVYCTSHLKYKKKWLRVSECVLYRMSPLPLELSSSYLAICWTKTSLLLDDTVLSPPSLVQSCISGHMIGLWNRLLPTTPRLVHFVLSTSEIRFGAAVFLPPFPCMEIRSLCRGFGFRERFL